jgi:HEAT repeat protein
MLIIWLVLAFQAVSGATGNGKKEDVDHAWSILKAAIANTHSDNRVHAVRALGLVPHNTAIREMAERALNDASDDVRAEAANTLGQLHASDAIPRLKQMLNDPDLKVVFSATNALYVMKDPMAFDVYYAIVTGQRKSKSGLIQSQLSALHNRKQMEKLALETGIGFVPFGGMAFEAWKTITHDNSSAVIIQALDRLASDPDPKSQQAIEDACYDGKWQIRAAAVTALAKRSNPSALDYAVSAMQDDNDLVVDLGAATVVHLSALPRSRPGTVLHRRPVAHGPVE